MQKQNYGQKMPLYEGADGKLYFNFAQGLKVLLRERNGDKVEEYTLEIVGCRYIHDTEYYDIERDGVPLPFAQSANRVKYLVSRYGIKTLAAGERRELPLLVSEVERYYGHREREYYHNCNRAEKLPEYKAIRSALSDLSIKIGIALAYERTDEVAALQAQKYELQRKSEATLRANGIDPKSLKAPQTCEKCGGRGYDYSGVCSCAIAQTATIKEFCAAERRNLAKLTGGNGGN